MRTRTPYWTTTISTRTKTTSHGKNGPTDVRKILVLNNTPMKTKIGIQFTTTVTQLKENGVMRSKKKAIVVKNPQLAPTPVPPLTSSPTSTIQNRIPPPLPLLPPSISTKVITKPPRLPLSITK